MKKIAFFILIPLLSFGQYSQQFSQCDGCPNGNNSYESNNSTTSFSYLSAQEYSTSNVTSDFGARRLNSDPYDWHGGIDYSIPSSYDRGDAIIALDSGTIKYLNQNASGIKSIAIEGDNINYGYRHLFHNNNLPSVNSQFKSGNFIFKKVNNFNRYAIINFQTNKAYGTHSDDIVTWNGTDYDVQNIVYQGDLIAPVGDSNGNFGVHLHVQGIQDISNAPSDNIWSDSNAYNPFLYINHQDTNYALTFYNTSAGNDTQNITLNSNGSLITPISIKCKMLGASENPSSTYSDVAYDIDGVGLQIKTPNTNSFNLIRGNERVAEIQYGGYDVANTSAKPHYIDSASGTNGSTSFHTRIEPNAYSDVNGYPWDIYHFAEFITRISVEDTFTNNSLLLAKNNSQARYRDGISQIRATYNKIISEVGISNEINILIDNFLPYVKKVTLSDSEGVFYEAEWILNGSETELILNRCTYRDEITDGFGIEVETSESLNNLSMSILDVSNFSLSPLNTEKTLWGTVSLAVNIPNNNEHTITFEGTDTSGNPLLTDPSNLYYRVSDTSWDSYTPNSPTDPSMGSDTIHKINLPINGSCACNLQAGRFVVDAMNRNKSSGLTVTGSTEICEGELTALTVSGGSGSYNWYLEGDFISDENPLNYTLPVGENNITVVDTTDPCDTNISFTVTVLDGPNANAGSNVTIQNGGSTNLQGSGGTSCSWTPTTGLSSPNSCTTTASPSQTTTYTLTVTENGCTNTDTVMVTVDGSGGGNPPANDDCSDAITLSSSTSCNYTTGTVEDATPSFGANNCLGCSCTSPDDYDVYYKFTAVETSHTITVSNYASNFDAVIELRTACSSGSSNYISCYDPTGAPTSVSETWTGLTIGQTYYIRVFEWDYQGTPPNADTFDICVTHQSSNTDGIDLISDITSVSNDNPDSEDTITINYTGSNIGDEPTTTLPTISFFLSTNTTLSGSDDFLNAEAILQTITVNETVNGDIQITLPNVADGQYYLVSSIDNLELIDESNEDNNVSFYAIQIGDVVPNGPDLDVRDVDVIPNSNLIPGQEVDIEVRIENEGTEDVGSFEVLVYFDINGNNDYDGGNEYMGEFTFNPLDAGDDETMIVDFDLPVEIYTTGNYEVFAIADSTNLINETNENNNDDDDNVTIGYVYDGVNDDVIVLNQTVTPTNINAGENVFATVDHVYLGSQLDTNVPTLDLGYYLSTDCVLSIDDILLDDDSSGLGSDDPIHDEDQTLTIPLGTPSGNYFILFVADLENEVEEGVLENNNVECVEITVTNNNSPEGDVYITDELCLPDNVLIGNEISAFLNVNYTGSQLNTDLPNPNVNFYLSIDCILSDDDMFIEDTSAGVGSDNPIDDVVYSLELPTNLTEGTYFIISLVDAENELYEVDENNNIACAEFQLFSASSNYQDVTLSNPYVAVTEANAGDVVYVSVFQNYTGYQTQSEIGGSVRVQYYLSMDCELSSDDVYLEDDPSTIGSTDSSDFEFQEVIIPSGTSAGDYYILFVADGENIVTETDENNNIECVPIIINDSTLSIDDNELNEKIKVYPNPVSDILTINFGEVHSKINIEIFNVIGQKINTLKFENKQTMMVNINSLSNGIYFFKIKTDSINSVEFKIIKE
jgi:hypothetical protein